MKSYPIPFGSLEKVTKEQLKKYFKDNDIWFQMPQPGTLGNTSGTSDFVALKNGTMICVEAKRNHPSAITSKKQQMFIDTINSYGGLAMVVGCEEDIVELDKRLRSRGIL